MMRKELMQSGRTASCFLLDPRTKILLVIVGSIILIAGSPVGMMLVIRPAFALLPLLLFLTAGKAATSVKIALVYAAAHLMELCLIPIASGLPGFLIVALSGIFTRFVPGLALGYYLVSSTTVSEFIASMERMHVPRSIIIPFAVMFRFFPTVGEEASSIGDAMRMRGIGLSGIFRNPMAMLEYRLVPLMVSTVKIGEELSAAALTRGMGNPAKRTNICRIGFGVRDAVLFLFAVAALVTYAIS